jgi:hypothetical protein
VIYGSPMGNSNVHNHKRCPLFLMGHAGGTAQGQHAPAGADGTPMANADAVGAAGVDVPSFGDSTGTFDLNSPLPSTAAGE